MPRGKITKSKQNEVVYKASKEVIEQWTLKEVKQHCKEINEIRGSRPPIDLKRGLKKGRGAEAQEHNKKLITMRLDEWEFQFAEDDVDAKSDERYV